MSEQTVLETVQSLNEMQTHFDAIPETMLMLDRRGRVHLTNPALEEMMGRPNSLILQKTFGVALGCIHTGDHPDGCMYGSICGDCFLHKAVKLALKLREPIDAAGVLAIGRRGGGVERPHLQTHIIPWHDKRRLYLLMSIIEQPNA